MTVSAMLPNKPVCEVVWLPGIGTRAKITHAFDLFDLLDVFIYIKEKLHRMKISALDFDIKRT